MGGGPGSTGQPLRGSCDLNLSPTLLHVTCFLACHFLFSPNFVCKKKKKTPLHVKQIHFPWERICPFLLQATTVRGYQFNMHLSRLWALTKP